MRVFFAERGVMEVETPLLSRTTASDPHLASLECLVEHPGAGTDRRFFLQTSPELAMKRLLAAESGPIYQISKAFRDGEAGRLHNPEFTILEWYRPGFDHHRLMDEVDALLGAVLGLPPGERLTYGEAMRRFADIDAHTASTATLRRSVQSAIENPPDLDPDDRDGWLDLLLTHIVEPCLGQGRPTFVHDYPASQAALARIRPGTPPMAERFEVWVKGVELANGYHELTEAEEQRRRFDLDNKRRAALGRAEVPVDERLLAALEHGLPNCAGVALGFDRLVMLIAGADKLADVMAFPIGRA